MFEQPGQGFLKFFTMQQVRTKSNKNPITWLLNYIREAKEEMGKVTWPSKKETIRYSLVVIIVSVLMAAFFAGLDWVLNLGLEKIIELSS